MGLIDFMSRNPVGLALPPSKCDEKIVLASINSMIFIIELVDKVILNNLANQKKALQSSITKSRTIQTSQK